MSPVPYSQLSRLTPIAAKALLWSWLVSCQMPCREYLIVRTTKIISIHDPDLERTQCWVSVPRSSLLLTWRVFRMSPGWLPRRNLGKSTTSFPEATKEPSNQGDLRPWSALAGLSQWPWRESHWLWLFSFWQATGLSAHGWFKPCSCCIKNCLCCH